ncbi:MAG: zinc ABC transporter substrate-binding protein ZnuA [Dongiaceae bacterium]
MMLYRSILIRATSSQSWLWRASAVAGFLASAIILTLGAAAARAEAPAVVASFKPVHSLVAAIMEGVDAPVLIVKGTASPHSYALTPSDAQAIQDARIIFWIGEGMETFLHKAIDTLPEGAKPVELAAVEGLTILPVREGGIWDEHIDGHAEEGDHEHAEGEHGHEQYDGHLWLDPDNARLMAAAIARELSKADPANAESYRLNVEKLERKLDALDQEIGATLAPVKNTPFIVFHDAYQYFDRHYGLAGVGSITVDPELPPGAKRLSEIRDKIVAQQARCVFREPNFAPSLVDTVVADTDARTGVLDPEGSGLDAGPELYFQLMRGIADSLSNCLSEKS